MSFRIAFYLTLFIGCVSKPLEAQPTFNDVVVANVPTSSGGQIILRMDIYKPANATADTPIVTWIHGGGWTQGSYNAPIQPNVAELLNSGISVATIGYRLSQESPFPGHIQDVKAAIRHLRANASSYGIDGRRIASRGSSAGGHLSALPATSGGVAALEGTGGNAIGTSSRVLAGVDYFGPLPIHEEERSSQQVSSPPHVK